MPPPRSRRTVGKTNPLSGEREQTLPTMTDRQPELDVMRALVVAGLVVFHSAVVFATGTSWFVKDTRPAIGFTVFLLWGSLWGMPLLFLVSGMGARYAMHTRSAAAFSRERLARLGVPFATGLLVLVPPMFYLARLGPHGPGEAYWRFWLRFADVRAIAGGLLTRGSWISGGTGFDPAHLWFLYVLLVFSVALLPLSRYLARSRGARLAGRHPMTALATAAIPMMATEALFGPDVNTGGWERLAYAFPFVYGFVIAGDPRLQSTPRRVRWPALVIALSATTGLVGWAATFTTREGSVASGAVPGWSALQGLAGWAWIVAILGFAASIAGHRHSPGRARPAAAPRGWRGPAARYSHEAVLPFYLLHEPVIVATAWLVVRWHAPTLAKYPALVAVSFAATLALYELAIRRFRITRFLFGMKPRAKKPVRATRRYARCA
jgi:peptidoglycan/LPS O-acetylase OafA/YrhL